MNEYQVRVYFASGRMSYNIGTLIKGDYNSSKLVFNFDDDTGIKMFELLKPDGKTKWVKEIVNNEVVLADTDELGEVIPLLTQEGTYIFEVAKYDGNSKLTSVKGKFKVKDEQVSTSDIPIEEVSKVELDDLINDVAKVVEEGTEATANAIEQANYAKEQGDYAKEQAQIIIDANTTATKIINDFETNVSGYTKDFNTNAEEKLEAYNQNDIDKTNAYNKNAESKVNSYNENAADQLKEYNDNDTTKLSEYNTNSETKTKAFDTNASEKTDAFNLNVTNKTTDFDSNAEAKTTEFNDNATTKTEEYNTNAEAKVNEFNATVDELKQDVEDCYNNMLTNEVEGTSIHIEDSANARIISLETDGNSEQASTKGNQLLNIPDVTKSLSGMTLTVTNGVGKVTGTPTENTLVYFWGSYSGNTSILTLEPGTYTLSSGISFEQYDGTNRNTYKDTFTLDSTTTFTGLRRTSVYTANTAYNETWEPMLSLGDTILPYEPYTGGQPSPSTDYPQEVEVLEGYNLFDKDNANILNGYVNVSAGTIKTSNISKTLYIPCLPNKTYTVSKISSSKFIVATTTDIPQIDTLIYGAKESPTSDNISITTNENAKYLVVYYYTSTSDTLTEQEILDSIQIVEGTPKPYVPYKNIGVKITGKNMFTLGEGTITGNGLTTTFNKSEYAINGTTTNESNVFGGNRLIGIFPAGTYKYSATLVSGTFEKVEGGSFATYLRNSNSGGTSSGIIAQYGNVFDHQRTFTLTEETPLYLQMFSNSANKGGKFNNCVIRVQIKKGDTTTEYEPYQENILDINLQGNFMAKIGDVKDTLRVENGRAILTKRIGKIVLDGSENWLKDSSGQFTISGTNYLTYNNGGKNYSSHFKGSIYGTIGKNKELWIGNSSFITVRWEEMTEISKFKTWLSENPVTVYYILAEPYEVDLGPVTMPKTFEGVTNISLISNLESNMKLKYVRSTNIVVDNLAKAIVALGGEINV